MKFYVWKAINGKWIVATDLNWVEQHDSWREAFDSASIMAKRSLIGGVL